MTTGVDWLDTLLLALAVAGAILTPLAVIFRKARPILRALGNFLEDWAGEASRPGVAGRPGVMERLVKIEREFKPNGGSSMRDGLDRVEKRLDEHIATSEADRAEQRQDLAALTRTTSDLMRGQGQQDDIIHNLSKALPLVAASTPPHDPEDGPT